MIPKTIIKNKLSKYKFCPECEGTIITDNERGESICRKCGLVLFEKEMDVSCSGIRAYSKEDQERKCGVGSPISILMPDISLSTTIDRTQIRDPDLRRATKWNTHLSWKERNMLIAVTELKRIASNLKLSNFIRGSTLKLYKEIFKLNLLRGRSINGMIAACLYYKCKVHNKPVTFKEILNESQAEDRIVKKCFRILFEKLPLKNSQIDPLDLIPKYCSELDNGSIIQKEATVILRSYMKRNSICGKDPKGYCGGVIYLVSKEMCKKKISQRKISKKIGITEVTLRSRYKEIIKSPIIKDYLIKNSKNYIKTEN